MVDLGTLGGNTSLAGEGAEVRPPRPAGPAKSAEPKDSLGAAVSDHLAALARAKASLSVPPSGTRCRITDGDSTVPRRP